MLELGLRPRIGSELYGRHSQRPVPLQSCLPRRSPFSSRPSSSQLRPHSSGEPQKKTRQAHQDGHQPSSSSSSDQAAATPSSSSSSSSSSYSHLPQQMIAAMALSPFAALALPFATDLSWRESASEFGERLRAQLQDVVFSDAFQRNVHKLDDRLTYMDWTFPYTGLDFSYVWDPEMWIKFREAVKWNTPDVFWNKIWDRISYRSKVPYAGFVGDMRISYAKFVQLLERNRIKRLIIYGDMRTAIVEVPHPWTTNIAGAPGQYGQYVGHDGDPLSILVPNPAAPDDPSRWFSPEMPEWDMEKYRFYVDLPGDFWESGTLLRYLREREVQILWDNDSKQYILPYKHLTKLGEVRTEVQLMDPSENWAFLSWLLDERRMKFIEKAAALCLFIRGVAIATNIISATSLVRFLRKRQRKKDKKQNMWERLTRAPAKEFMTKGKDGKMKDTGVRFSDIAGMPGLVFEMREIVKMLLKDPAYMRVGARAPRGVIFQGPPGTGKTYLARAIAGEAGVTFLSAVGSEFVEMFAGVAAARVNSLYHAARQKSPCIIFIDEIDAIGRSRSTLGGDPGSMERESALLSLLVQLDGIHGHLEQVLTIGATNLATELDQALLRPGRFEVVYEIPTPGPTARLDMLKYHGRNKPVEDDGIYYKVAEVTAGWSAAALANLMNEAAILTVRRNVPKITLPMVVELVEAQEWGPSAPRIPPSAAKDRLAEVTAAKAVAMALTPGIEPIKFVTMWSRRRGQGPYIQFIDSGENLDADWHPEQVEIMDRATNFKVNAAEVGDEPLGEFFHIASLLIPLYAGRAWEVAEHGPDQASLATAAPVADCFQIAYYCVRNSMLHPRFRRLPPLHTYIMLGNGPGWANARDPLAVGLDEELGYHQLTLTLLKAAWRRTQQLVQQRRDAIKRVAEELLTAEDEKLTGTRLVEIIESTPVAETDIKIDSDFLPIVKEVLGRVPETLLQQAAAIDQADRQRQQQQQESGSSDQPKEPDQQQEGTNIEAAQQQQQEPSSSSSDAVASDQSRELDQQQEGTNIEAAQQQQQQPEPGSSSSRDAVASDQPREPDQQQEGPSSKVAQQQQQQQQPEPGSSSSSSSNAAASDQPGEPVQQQEGTSNKATQQQQQEEEESSSKPDVDATSASASSSSSSSDQPQPQPQSQSKQDSIQDSIEDLAAKRIPDDYLPGVPRSLAAAVDYALKLDDQILQAVSRAVMGRLDIVDLVGKNTAEEVAERVVESLLDPATVDRLKAVRRYVEDPSGDFPPQPSMSDLPVPLYGYTSEMALEWWKTRHISSISFRASDMLFSERQAKYYEQDMDLPWFDDTRAADALKDVQEALATVQQQQEEEEGEQQTAPAVNQEQESAPPAADAAAPVDEAAGERGGPDAADQGGSSTGGDSSSSGDQQQ